MTGIWRWVGAVLVVAAVAAGAGAVQYRHGWPAFGLACACFIAVLLAAVIFRPDDLEAPK
jgi:hypothetical protein